MASSPNTSFEIDVGKVTQFNFLGSKTITDGDCSHKIKRCFLPGRKAITKIGNVLKSRDNTGLKDMSLNRLQDIVKDREAWHAAVCEVAKSQTQLSIWTTSQGRIVAIKLFLLRTPAFQLFSSLCFGHRNLHLSRKFWDFPGSPAVKNLPCNAGDASSIPGWETEIRLRGAAQNEVINSFTWDISALYSELKFLLVYFNFFKKYLLKFSLFWKLWYSLG